MSTLKQIGYEVMVDVIPDHWGIHIANDLPQIKNSGSRALLDSDIFRDTVQFLREHPILIKVLDGLVAVQCTFFRKCQSHNWSIRLHKDVMLPIKGIGSWPQAGIKEKMEFVRPPHSFLQDCVIVRVCLDEGSEGDLHLEPYSHLDSKRSENPITETPIVPRYGALTLYPTTVHGSSKLKHISSRRILHYVFGPKDLPVGYQWYYMI